ncbi:hypothetical protein AVEN_196876-1 [Araneus ventricosus]|uniref:Uncharacterized protein n=1 Tax=Araneus ventricosus TaxID=182803 RepID=A0A4Y2DYQ9_ARAVE|nr:hypothetical protein AVEN_196876-1 [Araneus ventricosus]
MSANVRLSLADESDCVASSTARGDGFVCERTLLMQASFISPVCSRTRSQVANRSAKPPVLNYDISLTNVISTTSSSDTGINKTLVSVTPSCDPSDEICKANLDSALTEAHSSVSFISPRSPIITGFVPSSEINSVVSSVSTLQSNSVLGDDLSSDSSNVMLLPSLDISFQDLSEASNDGLSYDIDATASISGSVDDTANGNEYASSNTPPEDCFSLVVDDDLIATVMIHEIIDLVSTDPSALPPSSPRPVSNGIDIPNGPIIDPETEPNANESTSTEIVTEYNESINSPPSPPSLKEDLSIQRFVTNNGCHCHFSIHSAGAYLVFFSYHFYKQVPFL